MEHLSLHELHGFFRNIDLIGLNSVSAAAADPKLITAKTCILKVLEKFLHSGPRTVENIEVIDGFLFIFNEPEFGQWQSLDWWEQRRKVKRIKDHELYRNRAGLLLKQSHLAPYIDYTDEMVAGSTEPLVKHAWMRKRLVLQECLWNTIDSISHAAYYQKKYQDMYPALCLLLCNLQGRDTPRTEQFLGIDNGTGFVYKKKSRESALFRFLYKAYKFFFRRGVFYIGGLELGLLETDGELSCHGDGAVVYQGW